MTRFLVILCCVCVLAGCSADPLGSVPRLSETELGDSDAMAAISADSTDADVSPVPEAGPVPPRRGLFARLLGGGAAETAAPPSSEPAVPTEAASEAATEPASARAAEEAPARGGFLGFLRRSAEEARSGDTGAPDVAALAAAPASSAPAPVASAGSTGDPDHLLVEPGTRLPYGTLARVCNLPSRQLGKRVERYPENRGTYALYDSEPGNTEPHTFYLTGFDDGCARQFTAALAVFGAPQTHEQLRYGLPSRVQPYSSTDAAYETLKSRICGVAKGRPCGSAMSRLARDTVFVSVYETFGSNTQWKTILLHDGRVVETDIRSN